MNRERFAALMGNRCAKWLDLKPEQKLDLETINRWHISRNNVRVKRCKGWNILFIVYTCREQEALGFETGRYYGTDKPQDNLLKTRAIGDWHPIWFDSLDVNRFCGIRKGSELLQRP